MHRTFLMLLLPVILTACATANKYDKEMQLLVGRHIDSITLYWGQPRVLQSAPDGSRIVEFVRENEFVLYGSTQSVPVTTYHSGTATAGSSSGTYSGTSTTYVQRTTPDEVIRSSCVTRFMLDPRGYVTRYAFSGSACRA